MVDHPENDPRVEVSSFNQLLAALRNCVDCWPGALNDDLQQRTWEDARILVERFDTIPRPPPGEIVVTDEMLDRGTHAAEPDIRNWTPTGRQMMETYLTRAYPVMAALDHRNRPVEPVAGDAVEAAAREIEPDAWRWRDGIMRSFAEGRGRVWTSGVRTTDGAHEWCLHDDSHIAHLLRESLRKAKVAIAAADRARGRAYVTWRRPEERGMSSHNHEPRQILIESLDGALRIDWVHPSAALGNCRRWCEASEMAESPPWATVASPTVELFPGCKELDFKTRQSICRKGGVCLYHNCEHYDGDELRAAMQRDARTATDGERASKPEPVSFKTTEKRY